MYPKGADFLFGVTNGSQKASLPSKNLGADPWEKANMSPNIKATPKPEQPDWGAWSGLLWAVLRPLYTACVSLAHISRLSGFEVVSLDLRICVCVQNLQELDYWISSEWGQGQSTCDIMKRMLVRAPKYPVLALSLA